MGPSPVSTPLANPSDALPLSLMDLSTNLCAVPVMPLKYHTLQEVRLGSTMVELVSGSPRHTVAAAYRVPRSGLRCVPAPTWWGVAGVP